MNLRDIFLAGAFAQGGSGAVSPEQITEAVNNYLDKNPAGVDLAMTGATVGQIAKITAVDDSGVPTAWEPVDLPSGGGGGSEEWELICTLDPDGTTNAVVQQFDNEYKKIKLVVSTGSNTVVSSASSSDKWYVSVYTGNNIEARAMTFQSEANWKTHVGEAEIMAGYVVGTGFPSFSSTWSNFKAVQGNINGIRIAPTNAAAFVNANTFYVFGVRA